MRNLLQGYAHQIDIYGIENGDWQYLKSYCQSPMQIYNNQDDGHILADSWDFLEKRFDVKRRNAKFDWTVWDSAQILLVLFEVESPSRRLIEPSAENFWVFRHSNSIKKYKTIMSCRYDYNREYYQTEVLSRTFEKAVEVMRLNNAENLYLRGMELTAQQFEQVSKNIDLLKQVYKKHWVKELTSDIYNPRARQFTTNAIESVRAWANS